MSEVIETAIMIIAFVVLILLMIEALFALMSDTETFQAIDERIAKIIRGADDE